MDTRAENKTTSDSNKLEQLRTAIRGRNFAAVIELLKDSSLALENVDILSLHDTLIWAVHNNLLTAIPIIMSKNLSTYSIDIALRIAVLHNQADCIKTILANTEDLLRGGKTRLISRLQDTLKHLDQTTILRKIIAYLRSIGREEQFIRQFETGYCSGLATVWLLAKWLQDQPNTTGASRDDLNWVTYTIKLIDTWQFNNNEQIIKLLKDIDHLSPKQQAESIQKLASTDFVSAIVLKNALEEQKEIDHLIALIQYYQHIDHYLSYSHQGALNLNFEDTTKNSPQGHHLDREYSIASLFTLEQLQQVLKEDILKEERLILISSHNHATALYKQADKYFYFDANSTSGETQVASTDKIAELIFNANAFNPKLPSPVGMRVFSFDATKPKYSPPAEILAKIKPSLLNTNKNYALGISGLYLAAKLNSMESIKYLLAQATQSNILKNNVWSIIQYDLEIIKSLKVAINWNCIDVIAPLIEAYKLLVTPFIKLMPVVVLAAITALAVGSLLIGLSMPLWGAALLMLSMIPIGLAVGASFANKQLKQAETFLETKLKEQKQREQERKPIKQTSSRTQESKLEKQPEITAQLASKNTTRATQDPSVLPSVLKPQLTTAKVTSALEEDPAPKYRA